MSKKKNILFISSWYPNEEDSTLGIFVQRHAQAANLENNVWVLFVESSFQVKETTITWKKTDGLNELIIRYPKVGIKVPGLRSLVKIQRYFNKYKLGLKLLKSKGFSPDIVHANVMNPAGLVAYRWKRKFKLPYVITEHWTGYLASDGRYFQDKKLKSFIPKIAKNANRILPVSTDLKSALEVHKLGEHHQVIRNVVDTQKY